MSGDDDTIIIHHSAAVISIAPGDPRRQAILDILYPKDEDKEEESASGRD